MSFAAAILVGTALLLLPASHADEDATPFIVAFFTAVSAVCVTCLAVVDTGTYWSGFGQAVIMMLFQFGGFGMMTGATLLALMVNSAPSLRTRLLSHEETRTLSLGDVSSVARVVLVVTLGAQLLIAVVLFCRFHLAHEMAWPAAAWSALFHAVPAFSNEDCLHASPTTQILPSDHLIVSGPTEKIEMLAGHKNDSGRFSQTFASTPGVADCARKAVVI